MPLTDEDAALQAIATLEDLSDQQQDALRAVNAILLDGEPFVDVHTLFAHYDVLYFRHLLLPRVEVLWSPRLTLCAGICELSKDPSTGKFTRIRLKLSTPLLQYRPRSDTINTLLHEAIHAYFFITTSWKHSRGDDGTGHGIGFQLLADAINNHGKYQITIYHTFHDEVDSCRTHVWLCDGPCKHRPPYLGLVKRSMNRPPGKGDAWWAKHQAECGGTYTKIQEPVPTKKQLDAMSTKERAGRQKNKLDTWITSTKAKDRSVAESSSSTTAIDLTTQNKSSSSTSTSPPKYHAIPAIATAKISASSAHLTRHKRPLLSPDDNTNHNHDNDHVDKKVMVECPVCSSKVAHGIINEHLDTVHFNDKYASPSRAHRLV